LTVSKPFQLTLDYSEEGRDQLIAFLDRQIEAETNPLARSELIKARDLTKTDDGFFRYQVDALRKKIGRGEWERYKIPSRKN
jgi:hypothetical protein